MNTKLSLVGSEKPASMSGCCKRMSPMLLGIPRASVSALESGKRRVSGVELRRLARLYRRSVGWLLGDEVVAVAPDNALFRATENSL